MALLAAVVALVTVAGPAAADHVDPQGADAAPASAAGFVDAYGRLWTSVERGQARVRQLRSPMAAAQRLAEWSALDAVVALRERNESAFLLSSAAGQFDTAIRTMYISGSLNLGVVLNVLGSEPDDVLRNIEAMSYLAVATGDEGFELERAQQHATRGESWSAAARIRADQNDGRARSLARELSRLKARLASDLADLAELVAAATPQTVVGRSGCPMSVLEGTVPPGISVRDLCERAVKAAATPQAAAAIKWALTRLGAPYACGGVGRLEAWRFDCSSFVARAYAEGAGLDTAGEGWAPSTRSMVPWDGASLDPHYAPVDPADLRPGDLVLYDMCPVDEVCAYRHVAIYLGPATAGGVPLMAQTNQCGGVAHVAAFPGTAGPRFLGARRVMALGGEGVVVDGDKPRAARMGPEWRAGSS